MQAQQLHDCIINPALGCMGGNYNTPEARLLLLGTAAIESDCGYKLKQKGGPALGIFQMEPNTEIDIWKNCDALKVTYFAKQINRLTVGIPHESDLVVCPLYACAMARLKFAMNKRPIPKITGDKAVDCVIFYDYYKRIYNTKLGASTLEKWEKSCDHHRIFEVKL